MMDDNEDKCKMLFSACESGDKLALIKLIKSEKLNPSSYDMITDQGKTLLHIACRYGHIDIVRMLVEVYGCSLNAVDSTGSIPFHDACFYDQVVVADYLLHATKEPNKCLYAVDLYGNTAFHKANQSGSSHVVQYILYIIFCGKTPPKLGLDMGYEFQDCVHRNMLYLSVQNKVGDTPPAVACRHGHLAIIKLYMYYYDHVPKFPVSECIPYLFYTASKCGQFEVAGYIKSIFIQKSSLSQPMSQVTVPSESFHMKHFDRHDYAYYDGQRCKHHRNNIIISQHYKRWNIINDFKVTTVSEVPVYVSLLQGDNEHAIEFQNGQFCSSDEFNMCHAACIADDIDSLTTYFNKGTIKKGNSPLHTACEWGSNVVVEYLITKVNCDLNACNHAGETPLHVACRHRRVEIAELLLKHSPNIINVVNQSNETPLHLACLHHDPSLANVILDMQPSDIDIPDSFGDTQLSNACRVGNLSLVKDLVEKGCNPFHVNEKSMEMPVHIACKIERLDILEVLMKNCVTTTDARNHFGETPLCIAFNKLSLDIIHFMLQKQLCDVSLSLKVRDESLCKYNFNRPTGDNALHLACKMRDIKLVELLLNHCSVDVKNNDGNTPFHIAAKNESYSVMNCLISSGDYPLDDYCNNDGNSALHLACSGGSLKVVQLLIDKCCVTSKNSIGNTPIHVACNNNSYQLVSCLLTKCSGNLDCHRNDANDTFLHVAAKAGDLDTIKILLKYCSTTCQNLNGDTPIHIACKANLQAVVECLLQETESTYPFVNKQGETYLHAACNVKAQLNVVETIIKKGYKVLGNYPDSNGDTPLHYVCRSKHKDIMEYLIANNCCDPYRFNNYNLSPIYTALEVDGRNFEFFRYILSKKLCDPNQPLKKGSPLLHCLFHLASFDNLTQYRREFEHLSRHDEVKYARARASHLYRRSDSCLVEMLMHLIKIYKETIDFNATDCEGNTILHLACRSNLYTIIEVLLSIESNIVLQSISHKNHNCKTPIQLTGDYQIIRLLISYGANPEDVYNRFARILDRSRQEQPLEPAVKVIVLGNSTAGKTTLVEALKYCKDVMDVKGSTAGIETSEHNSKEFGRVTFHDFAGQPEYESSHSAFLEKCSSSVQPPIFILVVNASQQQYIEKRIHNWLSFIKNHCTDTETPPHVIVIGSHNDKLSDAEKSHTHDTYTKAIENFQSSDFECFKPVLLDCRRGRSLGMRELQQRLKSSCFSLKKFVELDCRCHILFANLAKWFPKKTVVKVKDLQERIRHEKSIYDRHPSSQSIVRPPLSYAQVARYYDHHLFDSPSSEVLLPISTDPLLSLLKSLHNGGHILLLEGEQDSWIVMNQDALFKTVNGKLFAPEEFKQHVKLNNNTGVVPLLKLQGLFPQLDFNLIRQFLVHYEFCQQIEDAETLQLIHGGNKLPTENDESAANIYYFFPGYIKSEKPAALWDIPEDLPYAYSCGWMLQCQPKQFFETRFLHVLLLRLTFTFVASSSESSVLERKCDIWKNGIHWGTREGVEVLVEIIEEKTIAVVLVRCFEGQELEAVKLRTAVLKKVWEAKIEFCPKIDTNEYLIHPSELTSVQSGISQSFDPHRISMMEIAQTIIEGSPYVICPSNNKPLALNKLLYFEPYSRMDKQHVALFFSKNNSDDPIPPDTLLSLSSFLHTVYHHLVKVLKIPASELGYHAEKCRDHPVQMLYHLLESWTSRREKPTFQTLRSEFDDYSIFFGRDPLELCNSTVCVTSDSTEEYKRCSETL